MSGNYFGKYHIFRDPVHGFIEVYDRELDIINTKAFQRLRRIKQLALTHYVYHGANHTRFGHSIGVMAVSDRIFQIVTHKDKYNKKVLHWTKTPVEVRKRRVLLRLVALLHDVGHTPFSHVGEKFLPGGINHEDFTAKVIREDGEIGQIIDEVEKNEGVGREDLAQFFEGRKPDQLIQQICMGPLDADKIDYLHRDSLFAGVHYGKFDYERLIHKMCVVLHKENGDPTIAVEEGGEHAAEAMIMARFSMFQQVYFNRTRRIYDKHLQNFIHETLEDGAFPRDVEEFMKFDDAYFESHFSRANKGDDLSYSFRALAFREHFKAVRHTAKYPVPIEVRLFRKNFEELKSKYSDLILDDATQAPHNWEEEDKVIFIELKDGSDIKDLESFGTYLTSIKPIRKHRIYSPPGETFAKVQKECEAKKWK